MTKESGEYRLQRQTAGIGHFAFVRVRVQRDDNGAPPRAEWAVEFDADGETALAYIDEEVTAALNGIEDGFRELSGIGRDLSGLAVDVTDLEIIPVDTTPSAVRVASAAATLDAFEVLEQFELVFENTWALRGRSTSE